MHPSELARRRLRAAIWCIYGGLFLAALALCALDELDDEDQAAELGDVEQLRGQLVDVERVWHEMSERERCAWRQGWWSGRRDHEARDEPR